MRVKTEHYHEDERVHRKNHMSKGINKVLRMGVVPGGVWSAPVLGTLQQEGCHQCLCLCLLEILEEDILLQWTQKVFCKIGDQVLEDVEARNFHTTKNHVEEFGFSQARGNLN